MCVWYETGMSQTENIYYDWQKVQEAEKKLSRLQSKVGVNQCCNNCNGWFCHNH